MTDDIILPPYIAAGLSKVTREVQPDIALIKLLKEFLDTKIELLVIKIERIENKYGMSFEKFKDSCVKKTLVQDPYSFEVEEDYREWEGFITLLEYYKGIKEERSFLTYSTVNNALV